MFPLMFVSLLSTIGCAPSTLSADNCSDTEDQDGDGLNDCEEFELGTDYQESDSDGDGLTDAEEVECVSNPLDEDEQCYECGWAHNDPGDLVSEGLDIGDTMGSIELVDQCGEMVDTWDFYGEYHVLYMTAAW